MTQLKLTRSQRRAIEEAAIDYQFGSSDMEDLHDSIAETIGLDPRGYWSEEDGTLVENLATWALTR